MAENPKPASLAQLDQARSALAKASSLSEIKGLRDKAATVKELARRIGLSREVQNDAALLTLEAERKAGDILEALSSPAGRPKAGEERPDHGIPASTGKRWRLEASVSPVDFSAWVEKKKDDGAEICSAALQSYARGLRRGDHDTEEPDGKTGIGYRVIYADPPWKFGAPTMTGDAGSHYPEMSTLNICELETGKRRVRELATKDAVLFLWTTNAHLPDALKVITAWGFVYKTNFVWVKDKPATGLGFYHRAKHEMLLVATRGKCLPPEKKGLPLSVLECAKGAHSEKPAAFRKMIDKLYPKGKRIELFARGKPATGWKAWGNQTEEKKRKPIPKEIAKAATKAELRAHLQGKVSKSNAAKVGAATRWAKAGKLEEVRAIVVYRGKGSQVRHARTGMVSESGKLLTVCGSKTKADGQFSKGKTSEVTCRNCLASLPAWEMQHFLRKK